MPVIGTTRDEDSILTEVTYVCLIRLCCHCELAPGGRGNPRVVGYHTIRLLRSARNDGKNCTHSVMRYLRSNDILYSMSWTPHNIGLYPIRADML